MIYDKFEALAQYRGIAPEAIRLINQVLPGFSADSPVGKTVLIEDKLFILIQHYNTRPAESGKIETHSEFADLQMLLEGNETIYYSDVKELECLTPYNAEGDYALYAADLKNAVACTMKPGNFVIFFPGEGHMPCGDGSPIVKAVVKIHKSLLS